MGTCGYLSDHRAGKTMCLFTHKCTYAGTFVGKTAQKNPNSRNLAKWQNEEEKMSASCSAPSKTPISLLNSGKTHKKNFAGKNKHIPLPIAKGIFFVNMFFWNTLLERRSWIAVALGIGTHKVRRDCCSTPHHLLSDLKQCTLEHGMHAFGTSAPFSNGKPQTVSYVFYASRHFACKPLQATPKRFLRFFTFRV